MREALAIGGTIAFSAILTLAAVYAPPAPSVPAERPRHTPIPRLPGEGQATAPYDERAEIGRPRRLVDHFIVPIAGISLPEAHELLPNAARDYRAGVHEGIDFPAPAGTAVLAAADGTIARIDHQYAEWTDAERAAALAEARSLGYTPELTLDRIRGRQVWIDHGRSVVTRYAHLTEVAGLHVGAAVREGEVVGAVGSSGLPEGGPHLHFEIRVGEGFYGDGLEGAELVRVLSRAFR
jgi:murein DD-endopeptidase MepM/ murein hydrolase activator NlpD